MCEMIERQSIWGNDRGELVQKKRNGRKETEKEREQRVYSNVHSTRRNVVLDRFEKHRRASKISTKTFIG